MPNFGQTFESWPHLLECALLVSLCPVMGPELAGGPREHPYLKYVDTWLVSLAPMIGESVCLRKSKISVRKNSYWMQTFPKKHYVQGKNCDIWKQITSARKRILFEPGLQENLLM